MAKRQFDQETNRLNYSQLLFPDEGYELDFAVGMTYSLDMEALLGVPVSLGMIESMESVAAQNPCFLLEALNKSSDKIALFCNYDGIKLPQSIRPVYALLENSVFPVRLDGGANFHPKLWVIRYRKKGGEKKIKVIVLSRNLTFDRSMDVAAELSGMVGERENRRHKPLAEMLSFAANNFCTDKKKRRLIREVAKDVLKVSSFDCGEPYESYEFFPFGIQGYKKKAKELFSDADQLVVVSPFLSDGVLKDLTLRPRKKALITRKSSVSQGAWTCFDQNIYIPRDELLDNDILEEADQENVGKRDLHAKIYFKNCRTGNYLYLGSLNASANAFYHNVEFMLGLKFRPNKAGYLSVLKDLVPEKGPFVLAGQPEPVEERAAEQTDFLKEILQGLNKAETKQSGDGYDLTIYCNAVGHEATVRPLFGNRVEQLIQEEVIFPQVALSDLSELYVIHCGDASVVYKIPTEGIPREERDNAIFNQVIKTKGDFLSYVSFLLTDDYLEELHEQREAADMRSGWGEQKREEEVPSLYEKLLWTVAHEPEKLETVEGLLERLDPERIDDTFRQLVDVFRMAIGKRKKR